MKSYDKAMWHIDGGEEKNEVVSRFKEVFNFLSEKKFLTPEGEETYEFGMDSSVSLNSNMVNDEGEIFLDNYYDSIISYDSHDLKTNLNKAYEDFKRKEWN